MLMGEVLMALLWILANSELGPTSRPAIGTIVLLCIAGSKGRIA
jgi:hypothetical protein